MTAEEFDKINKDFIKRKEYIRLRVILEIFSDIEKNKNHLCFFRDKAGSGKKKIVSLSMEIPDKIKEAGLKAMKEEIEKEMNKAKQNIVI